MPNTFITTPRITLGAGSADHVGQEVRRLGADRCLLVTDPGLVTSGIAPRVEAVLREAGLDVAVFSGVEPDPRYQIAEDCARAARDWNARCLVGVGGGSSLDIAKVAAVAAVHGGPVRALFGVDTVPGPGLPVVAVPTTAGTGSEVTPIAILSDEEEALKKGVVSHHLVPRAAVLDPELTVGLPPQVTAATGMDALIHAVEAYTSVKAYPLTDHLALRAVELIQANLRTAYANGADLEARSAMLEGSLLAGMAFANAGVTAVHAFAYPLGAQFHVPHGVANSVMLLSVMRFNMIGCLPRFARLARALGCPTEGLGLRDRARKALDALDELVRDVGVPRHLRDLGVPEDALDGMARAVTTITRLLGNNPRRITDEDALAIYRDAY